MWKMDLFLQSSDELEAIIVVSAFAARVRQGHFGRGLRVKVSTVVTAMLAITMSIKLAGQSCPFEETEIDFVLPIKRLV